MKANTDFPGNYRQIIAYLSRGSRSAKVQKLASIALKVLEERTEARDAAKMRQARRKLGYFLSV